MSLTSSARLLSAEEIAVQAGQQVSFLRLPERTGVFAEREMRLRQLAATHPMHDFLSFMAEVARSQQEALQQFPAVPLPDTAAIDNASRFGAPLLPATLWPRDAAWLVGLRRVLDGLRSRLTEGPARAVAQRLRDADDAWVEQQADRLLNGVMLGLDLATAPLIAAGLQVYWTHLVLATQEARGTDRLPPFGRVDDPTTCPCCASRPTASVSRIGAHETGHRYLHCSLCSTQWHMVRIKCSNCQSTKGIHYQSLEPADLDAQDKSERRPQHPVEAETCDECGHYLKIVHMERDAHVEPLADDLATISLDLLVAEAGFQRHGVNLMLLFGDAAEASDDPNDDPDDAPTRDPDDGGGG